MYVYSALRECLGVTVVWYKSQSQITVVLAWVYFLPNTAGFKAVTSL